MERPKVVSVNENLTCGLCKGYLIEATTITICLHSFCHSCIINHFSRQEDGEPLFCPICIKLRDPGINPIAAHDLRNDHLLQTIVYKLVPCLYENEQKRRLNYKKTQEIGKTDVKKKRKNNIGEHAIGANFYPSDFRIYCSFDVINVEISEMDLDIGGDDYFGDNNNNINKIDEGHQQQCRYLLCPVMLRISHLKKFLVQKVYSATPDCNIILCSNGKPLEDELCLADLCYIFGLQKATCISIKYVAYTAPKRIKVDHIALEAQNAAAKLPLDTKANEVSSCVTTQLHNDDEELVNDNSCSVTSPSHLELNHSDNCCESEGNTSLDRKIDSCINQLSAEEDLSAEFSSFLDVPSGTNNNINMECRNLDASEMSDNVTNSSGQVVIVDDIELPPLQINDQHLADNNLLNEPHLADNPIQHTNKHVEQPISDEVKTTNALTLSTSLSSSSSSSSSTSTVVESGSVIPAIHWTTSSADVDLDGKADCMSDASSQATVASSHSPKSSKSNLSNLIKPCRVVLYRLPTACFLTSNRKRKLSSASGNITDETKAVTECQTDKNVFAPPKKVRHKDSNVKKTIHNLMIKYKTNLKELTELRKMINQLGSQKRIKVVKSFCKSIAPDEEKFEISKEDLALTSSESCLNVETAMDVTILTPPSPLISSSSNDLNLRKDDAENVVPLKILSAVNEPLPKTLTIEMQENYQSNVPSVEATQMECSNIPSCILLENGAEINGGSRDVNILSCVIPEISKQNSGLNVINASLSLDTPASSRCLPSFPTCSNDFNLLLKFARVNNLDKIGTKVVDSGNIVSKYQIVSQVGSQDVQLPLFLQKSNLADFVRVPLSRQMCNNRINTFQNTNAAIRSTLRTAIPPSLSNYVKPLANQAPELENRRQFLSAFRTQPTEISSNNSVSSFDLMAYLEKNQSLLNSISLANHGIANFPLGLNGINPEIRHNLLQTCRQSVSTQTGHLDMINQYFCRRSKPVPSVFSGRTRPLNSKRSFTHAFGSEFIGKRSFPGPSKKAYVNEQCLRIPTANSILKDIKHVYSNSSENVNSHKLFSLSSGMAPSYRHFLTDFTLSKPSIPLLRPLYSINQHRVISLTPPTEIPRKQLVYNGTSEHPLSQVPLLRPRSSSANAAEVYESVADVVAGTSDNLKRLVSPFVDGSHPLTSPLHYECHSEVHGDKRVMPSSLLPNQLSPRQKDSFHSIPRKSIFPIFSRSSKLHAPNLQTQAIFPSNKNGTSMSRESCSLSLHHQPRKLYLQTPSHLQLSGWNASAISIPETSSMARGQDSNNVTLDLSLSKKQKRLNSKPLLETLKVDISKNCNVPNNLISANTTKFSRCNKSYDHQSIAYSDIFPSCLTVTKFSMDKQIHAASLTNKIIAGGNDSSHYNECPNVIDFRKSMPVTSFKLCDFKSLPPSVSTNCRNVDHSSSANGFTGSNVLSNTDLFNAENITCHSVENVLNQSRVSFPKSNANESSLFESQNASIPGMCNVVTSPNCIKISEIITSSASCQENSVICSNRESDILVTDSNVQKFNDIRESDDVALSANDTNEEDASSAINDNQMNIENQLIDFQMSQEDDQTSKAPNTKDLVESDSRVADDETLLVVNEETNKNSDVIDNHKQIVCDQTHVLESVDRVLLPLDIVNEAVEKIMSIDTSQNQYLKPDVDVYGECINQTLPVEVGSSEIVTIPTLSEMSDVDITKDHEIVDVTEHSQNVQIEPIIVSTAAIGSTDLLEDKVLIETQLVTSDLNFQDTEHEEKRLIETNSKEMTRNVESIISDHPESLVDIESMNSNNDQKDILDSVM